MRTNPLVAKTPNTAFLLLATAGLALAPAATWAQADPLAEPLGPVLDLEAIDGTLGFEMFGLPESEAGSSIAAAGDVNGDGIDDLIIGAPRASQGAVPEVGVAHVLFGAAGEIPTGIALEDLDGATGFAIRGLGTDRAIGRSVSGAGDLNGDGVADVIIGASGRAYVVFGRRDAFPAIIDASTFDGTEGFRFEGLVGSGTRWLSSAGDFNGDGRDDVAIGAQDAGVAGEVYVLFGRDGDWPAVLTAGDLDGVNGVRLVGSLSGTGWGVDHAGDVNGDGVSDLVIGTDRAGGYVVFGSDEPFPTALDLGTLDGSNGFSLVSARVGLGEAVSGAGDINGDGVSDVAISNPQSGTPSSIGGYFAGQTYVVYGRQDGGFPASIDVDAFDGGDGFRLDGDATEPEENSGRDLASVGDVNGDGFDDLMVSAPTRGSSYDYSVYPPVWRQGEGAAYLIFGRDGDFPAQVHMGEPDGDAIVRIDGERRTFELAVSAAGDLNADGRDDVAIGVPSRNSRGYGYVVYGRGIACEADLDGNGELTIFDFLEFQNLFDAGDPLADFDGDGELTLFDFLAFQNAFDAGCP